MFTFLTFPLRKEFWNSFLWPEIRECSLATLSSHPLMIHGLSAKARSASSRGYPFVAHFIVSVARMQVLSIPTHQFEPLESLKHPKNAKHEAEERLEAAMLSGCNSRLLSKVFRYLSLCRICSLQPLWPSRILGSDNTVFRRTYAWKPKNFVGSC